MVTDDEDDQALEVVSVVSVEEVLVVEERAEVDKHKPKHKP